MALDLAGSAQLSEPRATGLSKHMLPLLASLLELTARNVCKIRAIAKAVQSAQAVHTVLYFLALFCKNLHRRAPEQAFFETLICRCGRAIAQSVSRWRAAGLGESVARIPSGRNGI